MQTKSLSMEELAPLLELQLKRGGRARLTVTGYSMMPMLHNHRDTVELIAPRGQLKRGDIALYRRDNGRYVLHRVIGLQGADYICCGDNQAEREPVRQEQVLAVVDGFVRAGKRHSLTEAGYRLYAGLWVRGFWLRRPYIAIRRRLGRLRRRQQNGRKKV